MLVRDDCLKAVVWQLNRSIESVSALWILWVHLLKAAQVNIHVHNQKGLFALYKCYSRTLKRQRARCAFLILEDEASVIHLVGRLRAYPLAALSGELTLRTVELRNGHCLFAGILNSLCKLLEHWVSGSFAFL